jgi:IMP cyclohydrolase
MQNPNGPYPGRQLFLGRTSAGNPAFAYLVTGRSPQSRERKATRHQNDIIMGPIGDEPYDWLKHYTAIKYDDHIGLAVITNGIQTEAIFETYRLLFHTGALPTTGYIKKIMNGARHEPDSMKTPRIAGVIMNPSGKTNPVYLLSIKTYGRPAATWQLKPKPDTLNGISTYHGDLENPGAFDIDSELPKIKFNAETPEELADYIYNMSAASYKGDDIRVCAIGGIRSEDNLTWKAAIINRHKD